MDGAQAQFLPSPARNPIPPRATAEIFEKRAKEFVNNVRIIVKPGADHGWLGMDQDIEIFDDWFDEHLLGKK